MLDNLYAVARTIDKYDLVHLVQPWARSWICQVRSQVHLYGEGDLQCGELIWIAWVFGNEHLLNKQLDRAVLSAFLMEDELDDNDESMRDGDANDIHKTPELHDSGGLHNTMLLYGRGELNHTLEFLGVAGMLIQSSTACGIVTNFWGGTDQVGRRRLEIITALLEPIRAYLHQRMLDTYKLFDTIRSELEEGYDTRKSGSSLSTATEIPFLKAEDFKSDVEQLYARLSDSLVLCNFTRDNAVVLVSQNIKLKWEELMKQRPFIQLSESHKEHLQRQRAKAGIPFDEEYDLNVEDAKDAD
jgi:hypothetical protein